MELLTHQNFATKNVTTTWECVLTNETNEICVEPIPHSNIQLNKPQNLAIYFVYKGNQKSLNISKTLTNDSTTKYLVKEKLTIHNI